MPLPLKPVELIFSKFTACFIVENVVQVLLIFVSILSYILALKIKISNILLALIPILTLPIIPMVYAAIICLIIMYFAKFIKNKELIKRISSVFVIGLFFFFFFVSFHNNYFIWLSFTYSRNLMFILIYSYFYAQISWRMMYSCPVISISSRETSIKWLRFL